MNILTYAESLMAKTEVIEWLKTTGKSAINKKKASDEDLEHIVDWLVSGRAPSRLRRMSFLDAKRMADEWTRANQKKGRGLVDSDEDIEMVHDFLDGTKIVKLLTKKAYQREGFLMSHCVGGYSISNDVHIYSYRDEDNMPHATFEVQKRSNEIVQIKGKGNGSIHPKYVHPILAFLKTIGMDISHNEMKYLGYYYIHKDHISFLKISDAWKQVTIINGEYYSY